MPPSSQKQQSNGAPARRDDQDEICKVCKTSRYLNPNMRFLVNPECYHRMCESCVDQIFSQGPRPCPIVGCRKTLRRNRFRTQTFEDLAVEREVDIRAHVASIMNRREDEFENLRAYNDYLEQVEALTFNLIYKIDVAETKKKLLEYQEQNKAEIAQNAELESARTQSFQALQAAQSEQARRRREAARLEYEEERKELAEGRRNIIDKLAKGVGNADKIARDGERVILKKSSARRSEQQRLQDKQSALLDAQSSTFAIQGLKAPPRPHSPVKPYSPFGGLNNPPEYYVLQENYPAPYLDAAKKDTRILAGGYDLKDYYRRGLAEAFAGLAVFVEEEIGEREKQKEEGTVAARDAVAHGEEDIFG